MGDATEHRSLPVKQGDQVGPERSLARSNVSEVLVVPGWAIDHVSWARKDPQRVTISAIQQKQRQQAPLGTNSFVLDDK